ncbi:MAG: type II toxin-antitoxin system HicB family antitoxin [Elusimicrobia bacterium CG03_land_8_20_14_0_80_50_18]|nr:MAG: type II toxin-antitoxin system HicB family antitoxin [Elusimicrobia bacterium CG03_land_8_20_14_0_80_50_18]
MKYKVIVRSGEISGYVVECPAVPGCVSQGKTIKEALENIQDAIKGCLEVLNKRAEKKVNTSTKVRLMAVTV